MTDTIPFPVEALTLTDATLMPHSGGDMAAGSVRVTYSMPGTDTEVTLELDYDTRPGHDGLHTGVTTTAGEEVISWIGDNRAYTEAPEMAVEHAKHVLSMKYHEAKTNKPPQTGVCFAGIVPLDDEEIAEIAG